MEKNNNIFNEDEFLSDKEDHVEVKVEAAVSKPEVKTEEITPKPITDTPSAVSEEVDDVYPKLADDISSYPQDFIKTYNTIINKYKRLPFIDIDAIYNELPHLSVRVTESPSLRVVKHEIFRAQAAQERLSDLLREISRVYNIKNRCVDLLRAAWFKFTNEKSADKRKADAEYHVQNFVLDFSDIEALQEACEHVSSNIKKLQEAYSKAIIITSVELKHFEITKGASVDLDMMKDESLGLPSNSDNSDTIDTSKRIEASEAPF